MTDDNYFLSSENPIANVDERDLEVVALRLLERPEVQKARSTVSLLWRNVMAYPAHDQMLRFDNMIDEYMFNFVLRAVNSDGCYPKVLRISQPPHHWFGHDVPGSRWGGDSPSFTYRTIPIAHGGRYEIQISPACTEKPTVTYTLMENMPSVKTLGILDSVAMRADRNGESLITIDDLPAGGRENHLQTQGGEYLLLVRDAIGDWLRQTPNILRVRRLNAPDRAPLPEEALAQRAARAALESVYFAYYCTQSGSSQPSNEIRAPHSSGASGGMATQWGAKGNLVLSEDEALIVTANGAGAGYRDTGLCDMFFMCLNYWSHTGALNMTQMAADEDGRFTYVVAHQDPGVNNWLDTGGLTRTIYGHRWQAFPSSGPTETPTLTSRKVKFEDLAKALPPGVRQVNRAERVAQIASREAGFRRRFIES